MGGGSLPAFASARMRASGPVAVFVDVQVHPHDVADRALRPAPGARAHRIDPEEQVVARGVEVPQPGLRAVGRDDLGGIDLLHDVAAALPAGDRDERDAVPRVEKGSDVVARPQAARVSRAAAGVQPGAGASSSGRAAAASAPPARATARALPRPSRSHCRIRRSRRPAPSRAPPLRRGARGCPRRPGRCW